MSEQRGLVTTSAGILFLATGEGKVRAYDEEDGKVLWTGSLPAGARGIPAMYEAGGREYLAISATSPIAGGAANAALAPAVGAPAGSPSLQRAYVVFALPKK